MSPDPFHALGDRRRREVLALVTDGERTAGDIAERFDVTRQAVSHHLRVLLEAGLVQERRDGARRWYRARPEGLAQVRAEIDAMWPAALGRLKAAAEGEHASRRADAGRN